VIALVQRKIARDMAIVACFAILLYLPTLGFQLVWDDPMLLDLTHTRLVAGGIGSLLSSEFILGSHSDHTGYFRPVVLLSLAVDGWLGSGKPWWYHLTNVLLHAAVSALVVMFLNGLFKDRPSSVFGGMLFAAHPIHVEAVAFVSGRTDLWAAMFVFSACLFWMRGRSHGTGARPGAAAAASSFCLALGTLSKELAMMTVPALLCWDALRIGRPSDATAAWIKRNGLWIISALAGVAFVFALRWGVAGVFLGGASAPAAVPGMEAPSALQSLAPRLATYLRLLAAPWPMSAFYASSDLSLGTGVILGAVVAISIFGFAWVVEPRNLSPAGLLWTLVFLVPVLGIVRLSGGAAAERFLYIPSFGFCLAAAAAWRALHERRKTAALALGVGVVAFFGVATIVRSQVWKDELTLYTDMARSSPQAFVPHFNLGNELAKAGRLEDAEVSLARAVQVAPGRADGWNNLGSVRLSLGKDVGAEEAYAEAVRLKPDFVVALKNLAAALVRRGRHDDAANVYADLLARDADDLPARQGRFDSLAVQGQWTQALASLDGWPADSANGRDHLSRRAMALLKLGRPMEALIELEHLPNRGPADAALLIDAGKALAEAGQGQDAERAFRGAIDVAPDDAAAHGDLGLLLLAQGDARGALPHLERAVALDPRDTPTRYNLALAQLAAADVKGAAEQRDALRSLDPRLAADIDARLGRAGKRP